MKLEGKRNKKESAVKRYWYDLENRVFDMNFNYEEADIVLSLFTIKQHQVEFTNGDFSYQKKVYIKNIEKTEDDLYILTLEEKVKKAFKKGKTIKYNKVTKQTFSNYDNLIQSLWNSEVVNISSTEKALNHIKKIYN